MNAMADAFIAWEGSNSQSAGVLQVTLNAGFVPNCARISAMQCAAGVSARVAKGVAAHMVATRKPNADERRGAVGVFRRRDGEPSKRLLPMDLDPAGGRIAFGMS